MADRHIYDDEGNVLDLSSERGAPLLAEKIAAFWTRKGFRRPRLTFVEQPVPNQKHVMVCVRSDMKRGFPPRRSAS